MQNRALIARWTLAHAQGAMRLVSREGKTMLEIKDYQAVRRLLATLLATIQRVKSEADYETARALTEQYATSVDPLLHSEVRHRYAALHIPPYKGFINPRLTPVTDRQGHITDIRADYSEGYAEQMLRYSREYGLLPLHSTLHDTLRQIKRSFRSMMNGPASQSMRQRGLVYKLNWGVSLPHLREMAAAHTPDAALAALLWREDIRECKILATLLMPPARMTAERAEQWMRETPNQEIAEMAALHLYPHMPQATETALAWIASPEPLRRIAGYHTLSRRLMAGHALSAPQLGQLHAAARQALDGTDTAVAHAALNCLARSEDTPPQKA